MVNKDKTGIICDLCTQQLVFVFTYYSAEFIKIALINGVRQGEAEKIKGFDWCNSCLDKIKNLAIMNYRASRLVSCDICGSKISDLVHSTNISEIKVSILAKTDINGIRTGGTTISQTENKGIIDIITCAGCYGRLCRGML